MARETPPELAALLEAAWQLQPEARPPAAQLEAALRALLARMEAAPAAGPAMTNGISRHPSADGLSPATSPTEALGDEVLEN